MSIPRLLRFAGLAGLIAIAAHLVWSAGVAFALERAYPHRVVDLRRWTSSTPGVAAQRELLARFVSVELRHAAQPTVAFMGSSFSFGYPWQERVILSRWFSALRPELRVVNMSVTGGDLSLVNNWSICALERQDLVVDAAIIEIPVIATVVHLSQQHELLGTSDGISKLENCAAPRVSDAYLPFVLSHARGLGWVRFLWDVEAYEKRDEPIVITPVPEGYFVPAGKFDKIENAYRKEIVATLTHARTIARHVYAFPSTVYLPALLELHEDDVAVARQLQVTSDACRSVSDVECVDVTSFYVMRDAYYNMTHLNQRGHEALARWLSTRVLP